MTSIVTKRIINPWLMVDAFYKFTDLYRQECEALRTIHDFSQTVITSRRNSQLQLEQGKKEFNFIDLLIHSRLNGEVLSDAHVREEVDTFVFEVSSKTLRKLNKCKCNYFICSRVMIR